MAIDPGTIESGFIIMDNEKKIHEKGVIDNNQLLVMSKNRHFDILVIEMFAAYGMPVGKTSFDTIVLIGRLYQIAEDRGIEPVLITRKAVKMHLCNSMRAKDKNITQAVKDRYSATGGGRDPWKGTQSKPGPLYGFKSHIFSALALGITYIENGERYAISTFV